MATSDSKSRYANINSVGIDADIDNNNDPNTYQV